MPGVVSVIGFYGKLPARGDFVRAGLPREFVDPWDAWLQRVLPASRTMLRDGWEPAWLEAPVWRFALPPGLCGPFPVVGLWMPSVDRVGRYYPLMIACVGCDRLPAGADDPVSGFLAAADEAGRTAIVEEWAPDALMSRLEGQGSKVGLAEDFTASHPTWWTDSGPLCPATQLTLANLPDARTFARMLDARGEP
ncbi:MAG: type VI secretion system-associated protein TagF [Acetobacteraceae bacterium]